MDTRFFISVRLFDTQYFIETSSIFVEHYNYECKHKIVFSCKLLLRHRFRFSIDLILVRELTLYTLLRSTPYIVIPVFGLTRWKFTKDGAREKEIICFQYKYTGVDLVFKQKSDEKMM